jgi:sulfite reductase (ferredoxin)
MRRLAEVGVTTREACGHTVRNVTADPLSGIAEDTVFDVTPYAEAAMRYFLRNATNQKLPRKFKITYSASEADRGLIPMHDFGLMAVMRDGEKGFRMSVGGGLGAAPRMADVLAEWLPVSEQLRSIEAAIKVWDRMGERRNKNKARIKFLVAKLGIEEFRRLWLAELEMLPPSSDQRYREPDFTLLEEPPGFGSWASRNGGVKPKREGFDVWRRTNALRQKQAPYYTVYVLLPIGDANAEQMHALAEMARKYAAGRHRPRRRPRDDDQ